MVPKSHLAGMLILLMLVPMAFTTDLLMTGTLTTLVLLIVGLIETRVTRQLRARHATTQLPH